MVTSNSRHREPTNRRSGSRGRAARRRSGPLATGICIGHAVGRVPRPPLVGRVDALRGIARQRGVPARDRRRSRCVVAPGHGERRVVGRGRVGFPVLVAVRRSDERTTGVDAFDHRGVGQRVAAHLGRGVTDADRVLRDDGVEVDRPVRHGGVGEVGRRRRPDLGADGGRHRRRRRAEHVERVDIRVVVPVEVDHGVTVGCHEVGRRCRRNGRVDRERGRRGGFRVAVGHRDLRSATCTRATYSPSARSGEVDRGDRPVQRVVRCRCRSPTAAQERLGRRWPHRRWRSRSEHGRCPGCRSR